MDSNYKDYEDLSELIKAMAHPVRLCIIKGLMETGGCTVTHMQNCLGAPQSTISQHIQKLKAAGIIEGDRNGVEIIYTLKDKRAAKIIKILFENKEVK